MNKLTYKGNKFFLNNEEFVIVSGTIHYFRVKEEYWYDRLLKLKECGFNCVETYTCWNLHEPKEGEFNFDGMLDIERFIEIATELGLYVILRPGPYICAEWDFGGLPAWLLKYENIELRCYNELFLSKVDRYYNELLNRVKRFFASNGGNIIMMQVENEYGSYGNDKDYLRHILNLYKKFDTGCLYFTSDGPLYTMLNGGNLKDECLEVANFGSRPEIQFKTLKELFPDRPLMCGEYWDGWFDHWGENHHVRPAEEVVSDFKTFMDNNWSINVYMFHGGTNFNFYNGANYSEFYEPTVTSYDYNALVSEAGDRTETYYKVREILVNKFKDKVPPLTAKESIKKAYGKVELNEYALLKDNLDNLSKVVRNPRPKFMEDLDQNFGYILYRSKITGPHEESKLEFDHVHDYAQIYFNDVYQGTYIRNKVKDEDKVKIKLCVNESIDVDILVENMGRVNYGRKLLDKKGIDGIRLDYQYHFGWDIYTLPMDNLNYLKFKTLNNEIASKQPVFLKGNLYIDKTPNDTFLRLDGFKKGFVVINGFNLGRYYEIGPQKTLYVPAPVLKEGNNEIIVFDSHGLNSNIIEFFDKPDLG